MKNELLGNILNNARESFASFQNEGKILVWRRINHNRFNYIIEEEEDFLHRIENRFTEIVEDIEDEEELNSINFDMVLDKEFDFDYVGWKEYYDPLELIIDQDYTYTYLINYVKSAENYAEDIVYIVHSNIEINSYDKMTEYLKLKYADIPGEFGVAWANHYFTELREFDIEDLYEIYDENNDYETICIDTEDIKDIAN